MSLKPLIKWSGGKSDEINKFEQYIPNNYDTYIEPFVGAGAVYFHLNPNKAVINDIHTELIDFYKNIKDGRVNDIYDFMNEHPNTEEEYYNIRDNFEIKNSFDNACRFYYLRKTCFRGMMRYNKDMKFNIPYGKYKKINYEDLKNKNYENLLKRTKIFNEDFNYIFDKYNNEDNFMFLDPPYDSKFSNYGYCIFNEDKHKELFNSFENTNNKCLLIIGKTDFIENLYSDYIVDSYDKKYKFKLYNNRIDDKINNEHLIIKNY